MASRGTTRLRWPNGFWSFGVVVIGLGCGLRTDPLVETGPGADSGDGSPDDGREGSCSNPLVLPPSNVTAIGRVAGDGFTEGWCGGDRRDDGPEDTYLLRTQSDTDVQLRLLAEETPFDAVLRVERGACGTDEGVTKICAKEAFDRPVYFFALANEDYFITVDSPEGTEESYGLDIVYGWPTPDLCPIHPMDIVQAPGGRFEWENELGSSQGDVDGRCGGPGRENMFRIQATYPGGVWARLEASPEMKALLSFRTNCAGASELQCVNANPEGVAALSAFIETPGEYFIVVDKNERTRGDFFLTVWFD